MTICCSFGEINKKYFYIVLASMITLGIGFISMFLFKRNSNSGIVEGVEANKLLKTLSRYLGFDLCYFGELILKGQETTKDSECYDIEKKNSKIIDFVFSDSKNTFEKKDILFFIFLCLINLIDDFMIIFIKIKKKQGFIIFNEEYNSIEFFFLFIISISIFKIAYYKHQYFSIILIIFLEIFRYIIKLYNDNNLQLSVYLYQILRALCDCIFCGYIKALIRYKYFSPYKCCYIFGFVNTPIIILLYIIVSHISFQDPNLFCSLKYNGSYYFDNFYSIFEKINLIQISTFFLYSICNGVYQILINITIGEFTTCHLFIPCQLTQFIINISDSYSNPKILSIVIISGVFEMIFIFIFLELIVLNCLGLNKNIKKSIRNRADEDYLLSKMSEDNYCEMFTNDSEALNTNYEDENKVSSKMKNEGNYLGNI